ncbi:MAG TPA: hypothetical protein VFD43_10880 [Planctomycetota bacterium]|nr:hypothetical protein [Planctomycetota bacterium]
MIRAVFDPKTQLLCTLLAPLADGASDDWPAARAALDASGEAQGELLAIVEARDRAALATLLKAWNSGTILRPVHDREVLKRAVKAFRKRLKLGRLDEESRIGGAFSKGERSGITGIEPPDSYPPDVWAELVRVGRLIEVGHRVLELPPE